MEGSETTLMHLHKDKRMSINMIGNVDLRASKHDGCQQTNITNAYYIITISQITEDIR